MPDRARIVGPAAAIGWVLSALPGSAAETDEGLAARLHRALELPAHRLLMTTLGDGPRRPEPFVTDGCSGGMSAIWSTVSELVPGVAGAIGGLPPWEACCEAHDRVYHVAGGARDAAESYGERLEADEELRRCVIRTGAERAPEIAERHGLTPASVATIYGLVADAMFEAVRAGGAPCTGLPWRWGYGFEHCLGLQR
jgi:hypothetical protein